MKIEK